MVGGQKECVSQYNSILTLGKLLQYTGPTDDDFLMAGVPVILFKGLSLITYFSILLF